jgi:hypothetical protein
MVDMLGPELPSVKYVFRLRPLVLIELNPCGATAPVLSLLIEFFRDKLESA